MKDTMHQTIGKRYGRQIQEVLSPEEERYSEDVSGKIQFKADPKKNPPWENVFTAGIQFLTWRLERDKVNGIKLRGFCQFKKEGG